jgi:hypothetical protein
MASRSTCAIVADRAYNPAREAPWSPARRAFGEAD